LYDISIRLNRSISSNIYLFFYGESVNSTGAACDQKTSKFLVFHQEESMAGHVGVKGVY
jgi:hypothetical protein